MLWWGRFDPNYSRNRILRKLLSELGWRIEDFHPHFSKFADWEASIRRLAKPALVWVPCFRQRDLAAASRWARSQRIPLFFDPLISAYDKQVDERGKLGADSSRARRLLAWEQKLCQRADRIIADTPAHAEYFSRALGVAENKLSVVYVGAEESLFKPQPLLPRQEDEPLEVLFYGSFVPLQGPETIIEAARIYQGPPVRWTLIGQGPLRKSCEARARGLSNVFFEDWLPYEALPARIGRADILLGIFGDTPKAGRVIPNKVYQALACGRAVVTRAARAYPEALLQNENGGLVWCRPADAESLANRVAVLAADAEMRQSLGTAAAMSFRQFFSEAAILNQLKQCLSGLERA